MMEAASEILSGVTSANAEERYQAFYPACEKGSLTLKAAHDLLDEISHLHSQTHDPVLQSFCLLFYSAVIDSKQVEAGRSAIDDGEARRHAEATGKIAQG